ncbi:hypothetical protein IHE44_0007574, partial [Lamprotornis superbus]
GESACDATSLCEAASEANEHGRLLPPCQSQSRSPSVLISVDPSAPRHRGVLWHQIHGSSLRGQAPGDEQRTWQLLECKEVHGVP